MCPQQFLWLLVGYWKHFCLVLCCELNILSDRIVLSLPTIIYLPVCLCIPVVWSHNPGESQATITSKSCICLFLHLVFAGPSPDTQPKWLKRFSWIDSDLGSFRNNQKVLLDWLESAANWNNLGHFTILFILCKTCLGGSLPKKTTKMTEKVLLDWLRSWKLPK